MKSKKRGVFYIVLAVLIIVVLSLAVYYFKYYSKNCEDSNCFNKALSECKSASFMNNAEDAIWSYSIEGKQGNFLCRVSDKYCDSCRIKVKLLQAKQGSTNLESIQGLDMDCALPLSFVGNPSSDLTKCSGKLKEGIQDVIIKKMYAYIYENIGKINEEVTQVS